MRMYLHCHKREMMLMMSISGCSMVVKTTIVETFRALFTFHTHLLII